MRSTHENVLSFNKEWKAQSVVHWIALLLKFLNALDMENVLPLTHATSQTDSIQWRAVRMHCCRQSIVYFLRFLCLISVHLPFVQDQMQSFCHRSIYFDTLFCSNEHLDSGTDSLSSMSMKNYSQMNCKNSYCCHCFASSSSVLTPSVTRVLFFVFFLFSNHERWAKCCRWIIEIIDSVIKTRTIFNDWRWIEEKSHNNGFDFELNAYLFVGSTAQTARERQREKSVLIWFSCVFVWPKWQSIEIWFVDFFLFFFMEKSIKSISYDAWATRCVIEARNKINSRNDTGTFSSVFSFLLNMTFDVFEWKIIFWSFSRRLLFYWFSSSIISNWHNGNAHEKMSFH